MQTIDLNVLGLRDGQRALDLGCGAGRHVHAMYYHAQCHVVGLDLGYEDVRQTRDGFGACPDLDPQTQRSFSLTVGNALSLPFPDASFDKVLCSEVLEHIPDYEQAVAEIDRILKPGGTFAVSVPRFWPERICWALSDDYHNEPGGHVRIFRESQLKSAVENRGLSFFHKHFAHGLHSPYWWLKCAVGVKREDVKAVNLYKRFLEWDITQAPWLTRTLEKIAGPLMGKSVVLYFTKGAA
ncbi:class I SAM-dependent methyltransferase [Parvibaculum sp.]|jgi:SAM-dependent methyltransferase|uniref:class I SAM-dependent methyltransferase n=1 Tax=Parvibaculum sp. TaxID=2024848 RepID=UPI000C48A37B|nr:class I SAM-dependent methyltransferase [Parvibaculum sp.]MAM94150.1 SAM-dependent methyltransferase [Parvibaculum sp.]|tara:strand:- start:9748 stop:10464 length:717 start_codon:yes stop_codon:yes gene_type:complete